MKPQTIDIKKSAGRILSSTIFRPGGRKLLARGHVLNAEDIRLLETEGLGKVWVTELEAGEVGEDEAVSQAAAEMGCGALEIRLAVGGRANLFVTEDCCVLVDDELLRQINCTSSIAIATNPNFSYAKAGQRIASVKSTPFAMPREQLEAVVTILRERGPIFQARPIRSPAIAVLYTDPVHGDRARQLFEPIVTQRLERYGAAACFALSAVEGEEPVSRALEHLLRARPAFILIASTSAPAGPTDPVGLAMTRIGCHIERFLAPVEPGNLLLLGYKEDIAVVSAPGCYRSVKPNVVDLLLPPLLSRYRISGWEIACMGHGGLLGPS